MPTQITNFSIMKVSFAGLSRIIIIIFLLFISIISTAQKPKKKKIGPFYGHPALTRCDTFAVYPPFVFNYKTKDCKQFSRYFWDSIKLLDYKNQNFYYNPIAVLGYRDLIYWAYRIYIMPLTDYLWHSGEDKIKICSKNTNRSLLFIPPTSSIDSTFIYNELYKMRGILIDSLIDSIRLRKELIDVLSKYTNKYIFLTEMNELVDESHKRCRPNIYCVVRNYRVILIDVTSAKVSYFETRSEAMYFTEYDTHIGISASLQILTFMLHNFKKLPKCKTKKKQEGKWYD